MMKVEERVKLEQISVLQLCTVAVGAQYSLVTARFGPQEQSLATKLSSDVRSTLRPYFRLLLEWRVRAALIQLLRLRGTLRTRQEDDDALYRENAQWLNCEGI